MEERNYGVISQILGPVVDVIFNDGEIPLTHNALETIKANNGELVHLEVAELIGKNKVRCISMNSTDGLMRGQKVYDTGSPIKMPVGKGVLGRMFNVGGEPIDNLPVPTEDVV